MAHLNPEIWLWLHNIRSAHNVGAIMRTAEGLGVQKILFSGYTPYPKKTNDRRLPYVAQRANDQISKTALGAEKLADWQHFETPGEAFDLIQRSGFMLAGLENTTASLDIRSFKPPEKIALLLGEETSGIPKELLVKCEVLLEIPMYGRKESYNVAAAAAIAVYQLRLAIT